MWKSLFGTEMKLVRVGGGMETSNFAVSYPSMQIFTFGPNVSDAHTINEHVEISSIEHAWAYLLDRKNKKEVCPPTPFWVNLLIIRAILGCTLRKKCAPTLHPLYTHSKMVLPHLSIGERPFEYRQTVV